MRIAPRSATARIALAVLAVLACSTAPAAASPPRPGDLRVVGGAESWHAENSFTLEWTNPPTGSGPPLAAVHYRVRNPQGATIAETRRSWVSDLIAALTVPRVPGVYPAEVWLEDASGEQGPAAQTHLRFDDTRPGTVEPLPPPRWIGRASFPLRVRLGHPVGPMPVSGIRGYAIAIDSRPGAAPCAKADRCTDAETTLRGGIEDDTLTLAALPEGTSHLHAVAVSGGGMKSATNGQAVLRVDTADPVTRLTGAPEGWTNRAVGLIANAADAQSGMKQDGQGPPPFTAIQVDGGAATIGPGGAVATTVIASGVHEVAYYSRDAAGNVEGSGIADEAPATAWVRIDRRAPSVSFANSQNPRAPELLRARIGDSLAGTDLSRGRIGVRRAGSGDRFEPVPSLPAGAGELRARWDSDAHPAGDYEFQAIGFDAAGNRTVATRRGNGTPMVLSNPLKTATAIGAFPGGGWRQTVRYGRGVRVGGRLSTSAGSALSGLPVRVVERFDAGAAMAPRVSTVRTGAAGAFSVRLAPGPSREVVAVFDGDSLLSRSASRTLRLGVRSAVRLAASSGQARVGGAPLIFRGRVAAAPGTIPAEGSSVQLQFRLAGLPWAEFRTVQTDRSGRFRYAYRFSDDDSRGARFQFRAYVPAQDDWPYEPGGSRPVVVRGL